MTRPQEQSDFDHDVVSGFLYCSPSPYWGHKMKEYRHMTSSEITVAEYLLARLKEIGVDHLFGVRETLPWVSSTRH